MMAQCSLIESNRTRIVTLAVTEAVPGATGPGRGGQAAVSRRTCNNRESLGFPGRFDNRWLT
jgi:hypothetical protein